MPKDEFDFDDPLELNGMAFVTDEDTTDAMCECFIEEFMRMGYDANQVLALFRNKNYLGPNMALQKRGEHHIRDSITAVFAQWGRQADWRRDEAPAEPGLFPPAKTQQGLRHGGEHQFAATQVMPEAKSVLDPLGTPIPHFE